MFEIFSGKKNRFIGIDFGTSSIKVVEISYKDQKAYLENYGVAQLDWMQHQDQSFSSRAVSYEQRLNEVLRTLIMRMQLKPGLAYISIPGASGLITIIELPEMKDEELANAIQFEAHKYIPSSLDEVVMSWEVVERIGGSGESLVVTDQAKNVPKRNKILLVAAPKKDIQRYEQLVAGVELPVNAIELETFSIARSLVGDDTGNFFVIDIGARNTNIILIEKGIVRVNRNIDAGGNEITAAISDSMNISKQRAEDFKKGEKDVLNGKEFPVVIPVLELIVGESQRIMTAYKEKNKDARVDNIIISGGTSRMKGVEEYFSRSLGMKVALGNPWRRIVVSSQLQPYVDDLGAGFSVAIGLALRGVEDYKRK